MKIKGDFPPFPEVRVTLSGGMGDLGIWRLYEEDAARYGIMGAVGRMIGSLPFIGEGKYTLTIEKVGTGSTPAADKSSGLGRGAGGPDVIP